MAISTSSSPFDLKETFSAVYRRHGPALLRFLVARARSLHEAEDLHAETFCRAWQAWGRFRGDDAEARAWLFQIARNLLIDRHRRQRLLMVMPLDERHDLSHEGVAAIALGSALIHDLIRGMSASDRELLALRLCGLSHAEIGSLQGRSEQAAKVAWHRTMERLRTSETASSMVG